jgi:hypothetical protein
MEERPIIRRINENILKKQSRTSEKSGPTFWGLGEVLTTPQCKNVSCYELSIQSASDLG